MKLVPVDACNDQFLLIWTETYRLLAACSSLQIKRYLITYFLFKKGKENIKYVITE